jgi:hypothetical protein
MRGETLSDIVNPWVKTLSLPDGWEVKPWSGNKIGVIRGQTHWYIHFPRCDEQGGYLVEYWFMTVRGDYIDVRDPNEDGPQVINSHRLDAADPEFFMKLERDIRSALDYLVHS